MLGLKEKIKYRDTDEYMDWIKANKSSHIMRSMMYTLLQKKRRELNEARRKRKEQSRE